MTTPATLTRPTSRVRPPAADAISDARADVHRRAEALLTARDERSYEWALSEESADLRADGLATRLMDLFRRTRDGEVFDMLVEVAGPGLMRRVRSRMRFAADHLDPNELLQDAIINVYSYPDRFDAARAGAFRAWSSTIVDNSIRRKLRQRRSGPDVALSPTEILAQHPDAASRQPFVRAMHGEDLQNTLKAYGLFLQLYLAAYLALSERERFVLQMVEVRRMRYAELAEHMGIRPEALKMVVFRARKRIATKIRAFLPADQELAMAG